jgi:hypothetical protein
MVLEGVNHFPHPSFQGSQGDEAVALKALPAAAAEVARFLLGDAPAAGAHGGGKEGEVLFAGPAEILTCTPRELASAGRAGRRGYEREQAFTDPERPGPETPQEGGAGC